VAVMVAGSYDAECFKLLWNFVLLSLCCRLLVLLLRLQLPTPMSMSSRAESGSEVKIDDHTFNVEPNLKR
jgi:hypothetical protein